MWIRYVKQSPDWIHCFSRFMVLRVRTNTEEELLPFMSSAIFELLQKRYVQVVIKQRYYIRYIKFHIRIYMYLKKTDN